MSAQPLLKVTDLHVKFKLRGWRREFHALKGVSAQLEAGKTLGIVGESGSGKTTLGRVILGLTPASSGEVLFKGTDLLTSSKGYRRSLSKEIQVVFQDPYSSLNPSMTIGDTLSEPLLGHGIHRRAALDRVEELLDAVNLPADTYHRKAREFSGGQRQRIAIARALALRPQLIICDEPVSALDLTTQERILDLLRSIQAEMGVAYLFISHDLDVVRYISDKVAVMRQGEIVESGTSREVADNPQHQYTQNLLLAAPVPDPDLQAERRRARLEMLEQ